MRTSITLATVLVGATLSWGGAAEAAAADDIVRIGSVTPDGDGVTVGDRLFFVGHDTGTGSELWVTDGSPAGTRLVADLTPGPASTTIGSLVAFRGRLWFSASADGHGHEWWTTDGTAAGTGIFTDLVPGKAGSTPTQPAVAGGVLYFSAESAALGGELWRTDGTLAGTMLVADIRPGGPGSYPRSLTPFGDRVLFGAEATNGSVKPYVAGPGVDGAQRLDYLPPEENIGAAQFVVIGDRAVFTAGDARSGIEIWTTRGQPGDARGVKDIYPGGASSQPYGLTAIGGRAVFAARDPQHGVELWSTDGTEAGTGLVRDVSPEGSGYPQDLVAVGDSVVFSAQDGEHGYELWTTRGTTASTRMVADGYPGPASGTDGLAGWLAVAGHLLYAGQDAAGNEPWATDGETTRRLADLAPGVPSSDPYQVGTVRNAVVFATSGNEAATYVWTAISSTTAIKAKRRYPASLARKKKIVLKVRVASAAGAPASGGTVTLTRKGRVIGTAPVVNGTARVRITVRLQPGRSHRVVATWSGVPLVATGSSSAPKKIRIKGHGH